MSRVWTLLLLDFMNHMNMHMNHVGILLNVDFDSVDLG